MKKTQLLTAAAVGYVLGARAGRGRYEQIKAGAQRIARDPRVQSATQQATEAAKGKVTEAAHQAVDRAVDKVRRDTSIQPAP